MGRAPRPTIINAENLKGLDDLDTDADDGWAGGPPPPPWAHSRWARKAGRGPALLPEGERPAVLSLGRPGAGGQREQQVASPAPGVVSPAPPRLLLVFSLKLSAVVDFAVNIFKTFFYNGKVNKAEYRNEPPATCRPASTSATGVWSVLLF